MKVVVQYNSSSWSIAKKLYMVMSCIDICNNGYGMKLGFEGVYFHVPQGREVASSSLSFSNNACLCVVSRSEYPVNLNEKQYN